MNRLCLTRALHWLWGKTFVALATRRLWPPAQLSVDVKIRHAWSYCCRSTIHSVPYSTLCMCIFTVLGTVFTIGQSLVLGSLADLEELRDQSEIVWRIGLLFVLWGLTPLCQLLHGGAKLFSSQNLRVAVMDHLTAVTVRGQPVEANGCSVGNIVERIELASNSVPAILGCVCDTVIKILSVTIIATSVLFSVSPWIALICALWMVTAIVMSSFLAATGLKIVEQASDAHAEVMGKLTELISNISVVKSFAAERYERSRFYEPLSVDLVTCRRVRSYWLMVQAIETVYKWIFAVCLLSLSLSMYFAGSITVGQLVTLMAIVISLSWHFESVAFHFVDLFDAYGVLRASLKELEAFTSSQGDVTIADQKVDARLGPALRISDIGFSYGNVQVLSGLSLDVDGGEKVAIVGPSGCGKSTLLSVIKSLKTPETGSVYLYGQSVSELSYDEIRPLFSESSEKAMMFNRSLIENLNYNNIACNEVAVKRAIEATNLQDVVVRLMNKSVCSIGQNGSSLSTGERQRLSIARALLKSAPFLLLDEATASIDRVNEQHIVKHVTGCLPDTTVIMVTHNLDFLHLFTRVVLMDQGRLVDVGSHEELINRCQFYRDFRNNPSGGDIA
jgi:ATP-binding cassette subfamily B protein